MVNTVQKAVNGLARAVIIAEAGVNHNGDAKLAKELVQAAHDAGADCVKFQAFAASRLATRGTPKVPYQVAGTDRCESHYEMLEKLELSFEDQRAIKEYCESVGITFCSTPYGVEDARFLHSIGVKFFKTASADLVDAPMHRFIAATARPVVISTGMATLAEIEQVLSIYSEAGARDNVVLLHCVSNYPADINNVNLRVMRTLETAFACSVGFSDHTSTLASAVAAVALGATVIERHLTLDKCMSGPDHRASSDPGELAALVRMIREVEAALGDGVKRVAKEEQEMRRISRKSVVAATDIPKGAVVTSRQLTLKRPGDGLAPGELESICGCRAKEDIPADTLISWSMVEGDALEA